MKEIVVIQSGKTWRGGVVAGVGLLAVGAFVLVIAPAKDRWIGWLSIIVFGGLAGLFAWASQHNRTLLIVTDAGLRVPQWQRQGMGFIPWEHLQGADIRLFHKGPFLCLRLRRRDFYSSKNSLVEQFLAPIARPIAKLLGFTSVFVIPLKGTNVDGQHLAGIINERCSFPAV